MRTTRPIRTGLLVVAASLPLTLVACGDDDEDVSSGGSTNVTQPGASDPSTSDPGSGDPGSGTPADGVDWTWYGLTKEDAQTKADADGVTLRILREDDESFAQTDDLVDGRVNAHIDDGIVTWAEVEDLDGMPTREGAFEPEDQEYLGLSEAEAGAQADAAGRAWRVTVRDGEGLAVTRDFSPDRLNFEVADDTIMAVTRG